jgi:conjugal transfer pilus assembly protein TraW
MLPKYLSYNLMLGFSVTLFLVPSSAKDLGVIGSVFEIKEKSLLELIHDKLKVLEDSNKLAQYQKELQVRVKRSIERPQGSAGIGTSKKYQARTFNPTFVLDRDIKDHKGNFIGKKGTTYNPLDYQSFGKPLLLINGDDAKQVSWALSEEGKIVLVQGAPIHLTQKHKRTFYFDQGGILTKKFSISNVPSRIIQREKHLQIEEINTRETPMKTMRRI